MKCVRLSNQNGRLIAQVFIANTPWLRLRGLLGRPSLNNDQAMLISPCYSVHTIGMRYSLDIVYLNSQNQVLRIKKNLKPFRASACKGAAKVLELAAGGIKNKNINIGDIL
ncbi:DUF192 domain-containing protein [Parashewanella spongiae]|uniref:DUF192 domain-containing protein n=2 Tax=Parashewanella spongiae TaxID=342950 RepID=A0A3A6T1G8_9GAMM|nr:DUF192 domain-containing protein [Parashewanella spongiae]MCL1080168.1 DUF192 domain-containing protein [Parashewanella spongiae]RJY04866.1 DUF192 domain-containing protein [Parashewanella spongiae]